MSTMTWTSHPDRARAGDKKQRKKKMKNETVRTATQVKINDSERQKNANRHTYDNSTIKRVTSMGSCFN